MKICLIFYSLVIKTTIEYNVHLGIAYIASALTKEGHNVDVYDCPAMKMSNDELLEHLKQEKYDAVGLSTYYHNADVVLEIAKYIKTLNNKTFTFIGGYMPTQSYENMANFFSYIDCMIIGEGEKISIKLMENLKNGDWKNTRGIAYLDQNGVNYTGAPEPINDLDLLPYPYRVANKKNKYNIFSVLTSRGCRGNCSYCSLHKMIEASKCQRLRKRSPKNVVDEIKELVNNHNATTIVFADDNFAFRTMNDKIWFEEFSFLIKNQNIHVKFICEMRADDVVLGEKYLNNFKEIGLESVFIGIENFVQEHLNFYSKNITVETNIKSLRILESLHINYSFGFMLFNPIIKLSDIQENCKMLKEILDNNQYLFATRLLSSSVVVAYPGTAIEEYINANNLQTDNECGYKIKNSKAALCKSAIDIWKEKIEKYFFLSQDLSDIKNKNKWAIEILKLDVDLLYRISSLISENKVDSLQDIVPIINEQHIQLIKINKKYISYL